MTGVGNEEEDEDDGGSDDNDDRAIHKGSLRRDEE